MLDITSKLIAQLKADDTVERCGFVTKRGRIVEVTNVHANPDEGFHMDPKVVLEHLEKGAVATWHTHPNTDLNLSGEDYSLFLNYNELTHYIIGRRDGEVRVATYTVEDGMVVQA